MSGGSFTPTPTVPATADVTRASAALDAAVVAEDRARAHWETTAAALANAKARAHGTDTIDVLGGLAHRPAPPATLTAVTRCEATEADARQARTTTAQATLTARQALAAAQQQAQREWLDAG